MGQRAFMIALIASFCVGFPTTDLVVPTIDTVVPEARSSNGEHVAAEHVTNDYATDDAEAKATYHVQQGAHSVPEDEVLKEMQVTHGDSYDDQVAKEEAIQSVCNLHLIAKTMTTKFKQLDTDGDGKLAAANVTQEASLSDFLVFALQPQINHSCSAIVTLSPTLGQQLCEGVVTMSENIQNGFVPSKFVATCDEMQTSAIELHVNMTNETRELFESASHEFPETSTIDLEQEEADVAMDMSVNGRRPLSKTEKDVSSEIAWATVAKSYNKLFMADYCLKDIYLRESKGRICQQGWYQEGLMCYRSCRNHYSRVGDFCVKNCGSGYNTLPATCTGCAWREKCWFLGCSDFLECDTYSRHHDHSPGCSIMSSSCSTCPSGTDAEGLMCYDKPKPLYRCSTNNCIRDCTPPLALDCGAGCALDDDSCGAAISEQITGVVEAMLTVAELYMTFGASAAATAMSKVSKAQMLKVARKNARRNAILVSKEAFQKELRKAYRKQIRDEIVGLLKGKVEEKVSDQMVKFALTDADALSAEYNKKFTEQGADPTLIVIQEFDPIGLVDAIDSVHGETDAGNVQASKWMNVLSSFDPTGILGAAANFVKHGYCASTLEDMEKAATKDPIVAPSAKKLTSVPARCLWGPQIAGSLATHSIRSAHQGATLSDCKGFCDEEPLCKSIQYSTSRKRCWLTSCQIGDPGCINDNDAAYVNHACHELPFTNWVEPTEFQACSRGLIIDNAQDCEEFARNTPGKVWAGAGAWPNDVGPGCEISSDLSSVYFNSGGKTPGEWGHAVCKVSSNWVEPTEFQACSRGLIVDNAQGCEEFARNTPGKVWAGAGAWPNDVGP